MAWTKSLVAFGKAAERVLIDAVPLEEISDIHVMQDASALTNNGSEASMKVLSGDNTNPVQPTKGSLIKATTLRKNTKSATISSKQVTSDTEAVDSAKDIVGSIMGPNTITIMTDHNGYNSGRKYYVQAPSDMERRDIVAKLTARSKVAKKEKEAKGRMQQAKENVARLTGSKPFQYFFAILIVFVSYVLHSYRPLHCQTSFASRRTGRTDRSNAQNQL